MKQFKPMTITEKEHAAAYPPVAVIGPDGQAYLLCTVYGYSHRGQGPTTYTLRPFEEAEPPTASETF
jgi:hypothetical protein